jgi:hypothetical protein
MSWLDPGPLLSIVVGYLLFLFGAAYAAERSRRLQSARLQMVTYVLTVSVYCTAWTFYGSVGLAANRGLEFLTIYLGPVLIALLWQTDVAVFRQRTGEWFIRRSTDGGLTQRAWGAPILGDAPVPADYAGDGQADQAVYRHSTGEWWIRRSTDGTLLYVPWGAPPLLDRPAVVR